MMGGMYDGREWGKGWDWKRQASYLIQGFHREREYNMRTQLETKTGCQEY